MSSTKSATDTANTAALVLGLSPAVAAASVYGSLSHSMGILFQNAVEAQKRQNLIGDLAVMQGLLLGLTTTVVDAVDELETLDPATELEAILAAMDKKQ